MKKECENYKSEGHASDRVKYLGKGYKIKDKKKDKEGENNGYY